MPSATAALAWPTRRQSHTTARYRCREARLAAQGRNPRASTLWDCPISGLGIGSEGSPNLYQDVAGIHGDRPCVTSNRAIGSWKKKTRRQRCSSSASSHNKGRCLPDARQELERARTPPAGTVAAQQRRLTLPCSGSIRISSRPCTGWACFICRPDRSNRARSGFTLRSSLTRTTWRRTTIMASLFDLSDVSRTRWLVSTNPSRRRPAMRSRTSIVQPRSIVRSERAKPLQVLIGLFRSSRVSQLPTVKEEMLCCKSGVHEKLWTISNRRLH